MSQTKAQLVSGTTAQDLTVDNINTTSINSGQTSGRKNLIINGSMQVSQRGTSFSGTAQQYTLDRMQMNTAGNDEIAQTEQAAVTSGGAYTAGFRKCMKIINGNQTGGAGAADFIHLKMVLEAQDIANSGWNYTSATNYITLSFWVKSSVAQDFPITLRSEDGTRQVYNMTTGSLSADTWTKVTKTIPGNSNLQFDDNNAAGLTFFINAFAGTDYTTGGLAQNAWSAWSGAKQGDNMTSTWYTTNDATLEITGLQLELGSTATDFEHRSFGEEIALCGRYYQKLIDANTKALGIGLAYNGSTIQLSFPYPLGKMRTAPSIDAVTGADYWRVEGGGVTIQVDGSWIAEHSTDTQMSFYGVPDATLSTVGLSHYVRSLNSAAKFAFSAEL